MTLFDIENIVSDVDVFWLKESIDEMKTQDVIAVYKALQNTVEVCAKCVNYPSVIYNLCELQYLFGLELVSRYLSKCDDEEA